MTTPPPSLPRKLQQWQAKLLDLSHANRLLYFKPTKLSSVPLTFPEPDKLFQQLVVQGKALTFPVNDSLGFNLIPPQRCSRL